jgi:sugar-phosphatase
MTRPTLRSTDSDWSLEVDGVLLDADGTLVDSTRAIERMWWQFLDWYGLPASSFPSPLHGFRAEEHVRRLLPADEVDDALRRLIKLEETDADGIGVIPGARALLEGLDAAQVPWAVVTSGTRAVAELRLRTAGLPVPARLVAAEDVARGKPDPEPYLAGRALLGLSALDLTVVAFEDAPAGITSAIAAGCPVVGVASNHAPADLAGTTLVVPDLTTLTISR